MNTDIVENKGRQYGKSYRQQLMKEALLNSGLSVVTVTNNGLLIEGDNENMINVTPPKEKK